MPPAGFETATPERPQTCALDRENAGLGRGVWNVVAGNAVYNIL